MQSYEKFNEFRYFRDVSVLWLTRHSKFPIQQILQKKLNDFAELNKLFTNDLLATYKDLRSQMNFDGIWLFPTDAGNFYLPVKFAQNIQRLLGKANMPTKPHHPNKMSQAQVDAILGLRFSIQRPCYQQTLACAMLGLLAMRPQEVANLQKKDIDLETQTIFLENTKSQKPQEVPLHLDLVEPLRSYLAHLDPNEPLFVTEAGRQWSRKDVYRAVAKFSSQYGLQSINPRRLRSTVGHELMYHGVILNRISLVLRHSDNATTARHYVHLHDIAEARNVINQFRPVAASTE